jgi:RNA polymerase sigma-70 factor (ECF subfamily)
MEKSNHIMEQLKQLYEKYAPGMIFYARKFVDHQTAEDIVHDIFLKMVNRDNLIIIDESIASYLFRAVQNACKDYLKRKSVREDYLGRAILELKIEELEFAANPINRMIYEEQIASIYKAIDQLPEKCREIFVLAYLEEKKNAEIAESLHLSIRTVEAQIYKALKTIRNMLRILILLLWVN